MSTSKLPQSNDAKVSKIKPKRDFIDRETSWKENIKSWKA